MKDIKSILVPTLVLVIVATFIASVLAITYNVAGVGNIDTGLKQEQLDEYISTVLPEGTKLLPQETTVVNERLVAIYVDENKKGMAMHVQAVGYAGKSSPIEALVGFDTDGKITGIEIVKCQETPGLGTKVKDSKYLENYIGVSGSSETVDTITSATISSKALREGVQNAMDIFEQVKGDIF